MENETVVFFEIGGRNGKLANPFVALSFLHDPARFTLKKE
jgi:hypothetical protein